MHIQKIYLYIKYNKIWYISRITCRVIVTDYIRHGTECRTQRGIVIIHPEGDGLQLVGVPFGLVAYQQWVKHGRLYTQEGYILWTQAPLCKKLHCLKRKQTAVTKYKEHVSAMKNEKTTTDEITCKCHKLLRSAVFLNQSNFRKIL